MTHPTDQELRDWCNAILDPADKSGIICFEEIARALISRLPKTGAGQITDADIALQNEIDMRLGFTEVPAPPTQKPGVEVRTPGTVEVCQFCRRRNDESPPNAIQDIQGNLPIGWKNCPSFMLCPIRSSTPAQKAELVPMQADEFQYQRDTIINFCKEGKAKDFDASFVGAAWILANSPHADGSGRDGVIAAANNLVMYESTNGWTYNDGGQLRNAIRALKFSPAATGLDAEKGKNHE